MWQVFVAQTKKQCGREDLPLLDLFLPVFLLEFVFFVYFLCLSPFPLSFFLSLPFFCLFLFVISLSLCVTYTSGCFFVSFLAGKFNCLRKKNVTVLAGLIK